MNKQSLRWWVGYFKCSRPYHAYCQAKRAGNEEQCKLLEEKFERIAELYADWGDIHVGDLIRDEKAWEGWLKARRALFMQSRLVMQVFEPEKYVGRPGHVLLDVPLTEKPSQVIATLKQYVEWYYRARKAAREQLGERAKIPLAADAKYSIHTAGKDLTAATVKTLRKAAYVAGFRRKRVHGKALSITETVLAIKQDPKNPSGGSSRRKIR